MIAERVPDLERVHKPGVDAPVERTHEADLFRKCNTKGVIDEAVVREIQRRDNPNGQKKGNRSENNRLAVGAEKAADMTEKSAFPRKEEGHE
jgi:hypothetical protein